MATPVVGQRLSYDGALCTVRYVGEVAGASSGLWLGVEWDDRGRGKHDGVHRGVRYFTCRTGREGVDGENLAYRTASFVRPTRPADRTRTFLEAVRDKYASTEAPVTTATVFSGSKVAEEVGFEKVRRQMAQIESLRVVILDAMRVVSAGVDEAETASIRTTCPSIVELDLGRNLFTAASTVATICRQLPGLRTLRVNDNRFEIDDGLAGAFDGVRELSVEETLLSWDEIGRFAVHFPALVSLTASSNQLIRLPPLPSTAALPATLTTLNLEFNDFTALSDMASLAGLPALRNFHLKGNSIALIAKEKENENENENVPAFSFSSTLHYVDLSYNRVASWAFVDALPTVFPGLTSLRLAHNPIYDNPSLDDEASRTAQPSTTSTSSATASSEEAYMITIGRLAGLRTLNFSTVTPTDRSNAEMFYLSRIGRQMAAVPEGDPEAAVVASHRRYAELCELYGEPAVMRHAVVNPSFLEARLVRVLFCLTAAGTSTAVRQRTVEIPKATDMYAVKGMAGRLFGLSPQRLRLVWETGEWDPVGELDEEGGSDVEDEEDQEAAETAREAKEAKEAEQAQDIQEIQETKEVSETEAIPDDGQQENKAGRWIKREVELKDSPRQFGFCVDGMEVRIRVEVR